MEKSFGEREREMILRVDGFRREFGRERGDIYTCQGWQEINVILWESNVYFCDLMSKLTGGPPVYGSRASHRAS